VDVKHLGIYALYPHPFFAFATLLFFFLFSAVTPGRSPQEEKTEANRDREEVAGLDPKRDPQTPELSLPSPDGKGRA